MSANQHQAKNAHATPVVKKDVKKENTKVPEEKQGQGNSSAPEVKKTTWKEWSALKYVIL